MKKSCLYDRAYQGLLQALNPAELAGGYSSSASYYDRTPDSYSGSSSPTRSQPLFTIDDLGNAHLDPFRTYPSELSPECISEVLTYCESFQSKSSLYDFADDPHSNQGNVAKAISWFRP